MESRCGRARRIDSDGVGGRRGGVGAVLAGMRGLEDLGLKGRVERRQSVRKMMNGRRGNNGGLDLVRMAYIA